MNTLYESSYIVKPFSFAQKVDTHISGNGTIFGAVTFHPTDTRTRIDKNTLLDFSSVRIYAHLLDCCQTIQRLQIQYRTPWTISGLKCAHDVNQNKSRNVSPKNKVFANKIYSLGNNSGRAYFIGRFSCSHLRYT